MFISLFLQLFINLFIRLCIFFLYLFVCLIITDIKTHVFEILLNSTSCAFICNSYPGVNGPLIINLF